MTQYADTGSIGMDTERPSKKRKIASKVATPQREHHTQGAPNAAREVVFNTPELLETIISHLPPRDILTVAQRLSRCWKDAVDHSPTIKAKLGIRSQGVTAKTPIQFTDLQQFPTGDSWAKMGFPMYSCDLRLNPNFFGKTLDGVHMRWEGGCPDARVHDDSGVLWSSPTLRFGSYPEEEYGQPSFGPSRTWRDMYLTQPPITTGILQLHPSVEHQDRDSSTVYISVRDHSGTTLGLLHDTIVASLGPEFRKNLASGHGEFFWGEFRFVTDCENLTEQCLRTIFEQ